MLASPGVANGVVYVESKDNYVYAISARAGMQAWRAQVGWVLLAPQHVSTGIALQELDAKSADAGWSYSPPTSGAFASTSAVAGGVVFIGCTDDSVYALRA